MPIDKLSLWGADNNEAPGAEKIEDGWVAGEQPRADWQNWVHNRDEVKVNEIIDDSPSLFPTEESAQTQLMRRQFNQASALDWASRMSEINRITSSSTNKYVDLAFFVAGITGAYADVDYPAHRYLLALDAAHCCCDIIDTETRLEVDSIVFGQDGDLPAAPRVWIPRAMCTDGTSIYIYFWDTSLDPAGYARAQAYDIQTKARKSEWPETGIALPTIGAGAIDETITGDIEFVSASCIAIANPKIEHPFTTMITTLYASDGDVIGSGKGDYDATLGGGNTCSARQLCGDGTNVYFIAVDDGGTPCNQVCSAKIADPTQAGIVSGDWPHFEDADDHRARGIWHTGSAIFASWYDSGGSDPDILSVHTSSLGFMSYIHTDDKTRISTGGAMCCDGLTLWMRGSAFSPASDPDYTYSTIFRIQLGQLPVAVTSHPPALIEHMLGYKITITDSESGEPAEKSKSPIIFDGRDIWYVGDRRASQPGSGYLYRIPRAALR